MNRKKDIENQPPTESHGFSRKKAGKTVLHLIKGENTTNLKILDVVQPFAEFYGFSRKKAGKNIFYRIRNDVAQGFELEEKRTRTHLFYTLSFGVQALCNPDARLFISSFDSRDIGNLMPQYARWPFFVLRNHPEELPACGEQMCITIERYLIPYFDLYDSCIQANKGLPELDGFNGADLEAAHFALKCGDRQKALACIAAMIRQRTSGASEERLKNPNEIDRALQAKYDFFAHASDHEIQAYIQENETRAREFLQGLK